MSDNCKDCNNKDLTYDPCEEQELDCSPFVKCIPLTSLRLNPLDDGELQYVDTAGDITTITLSSDGVIPTLLSFNNETNELTLTLSNGVNLITNLDIDNCPKKPIKRVNSDYTVNFDEDGLILVDASSNDVNIQLPLANTRPSDELSVVDIMLIDDSDGTYTASIVRTGTDLIDNSSSPTQLQLMSSLSPKAEVFENIGYWWLR